MRFRRGTITIHNATTDELREVPAIIAESGIFAINGILDATGMGMDPADWCCMVTHVPTGFWIPSPAAMTIRNAKRFIALLEAQDGSDVWTSGAFRVGKMPTKAWQKKAKRVWKSACRGSA